VLEVCLIPEDVEQEEWRLRYWLRNTILESRFFPLLAALFLMLFIVYPLAGELGSPGLLLNVFVLLMFIVSLRAVANNRAVMRTVLLMAIPLFASRLWAHYGDGVAPLITYAVLNSIFLATVLALCLTRVLDSKPVTEDKIMGALCVYLLIGVLFSFVYEINYTLDPTAIDLGAEYSESLDPEEFWVFIYFSFVTLTTLGYGDVLPVAPFARAMATLEAVVGPLYLAILIARLVSAAETTQGSRKSERRVRAKE